MGLSLSLSVKCVRMRGERKIRGKGSFLLSLHLASSRSSFKAGHFRNIRNFFMLFYFYYFSGIRLSVGFEIRISIPVEFLADHIKLKIFSLTAPRAWMGARRLILFVRLYNEIGDATQYKGIISS